MSKFCYKCCNNWKLLRDGFLSLLILIVIAFILGWITNILPIKWINIQHRENVWDTWAYYLTAAGTAILAAIAYFKAESIQKDNRPLA